MVGNFVTVTTPLAYVINADTKIALQSTLDAIAPGLLGLVLTLLVTWALRRGMSTGRVMIIAVVVSLVLGYFKILA
jgi:PTS system mannose-specific IID component